LLEFGDPVVMIDVKNNQVKTRLKLQKASVSYKRFTDQRQHSNEISIDDGSSRTFLLNQVDIQ
jgi:hypothetical protein